MYIRSLSHSAVHLQSHCADMGASVVISLDELDQTKHLKKLVIINREKPGELADLLEKIKQKQNAIQVVDEKWLLACTTYWTLEPLDPYLASVEGV